jgi:hypothetical protein
MGFNSGLKGLIINRVDYKYTVYTSTGAKKGLNFVG